MFRMGLSLTLTVLTAKQRVNLTQGAGSKLGGGGEENRYQKQLSPPSP